MPKRADPRKALRHKGSRAFPGLANLCLVETMSDSTRCSLGRRLPASAPTWLPTTSFRAGLLRHIAMEEKALLSAVQESRGGLPLPVAKRLWLRAVPAVPVARHKHGPLVMGTRPTGSPTGRLQPRSMIPRVGSV